MCHTSCPHILRQAYVQDVALPALGFLREWAYSATSGYDKVLHPFAFSSNRECLKKAQTFNDEHS